MMITYGGRMRIKAAIINIAAYFTFSIHCAYMTENLN